MLTKQMHQKNAIFFIIGNLNILVLNINATPLNHIFAMVFMV